MNKDKRYYRLPDKSRNRVSPFAIIIPAIALLLLLGGGYLLLLTQTPALPVIANLVKSEIDLNTADDTTDNRDRIQIAKLGLEVPFASQGGAELLDKGVWHRFPERGNPVDGGNFILSAHRFAIGTTPRETKTRSPFYNLDKLVVGDSIRVFYEGTWYEYEIKKMYGVEPNAIEIEAPSDNAKMTLYTCTLQGSADGRLVIDARLR